MKFTHGVFLHLLFSIVFTTAAPTFGNIVVKRGGVEGNYVGTMDLVFDRPRKINIEVALTLTGETVTVQLGPNQFEERQIIDGAFLVDDEGGPFTFSKVTYNLDKNQIDLRYDRTRYNGSTFPADFRLVGKFDSLGKISGNVMSGNRGPIGTFQISPVSQTGLRVKRKYDGGWRGVARLYPSGGVRNFDIVIGAGLKVVTNPFDFEFEFTPGKMAYWSLDGMRFNFNNIAVDYLRQRIFLTNLDGGGRNTLTAECDVDFEAGTMRGNLYGMYKGKSAELFLRRAN